MSLLDDENDLAFEGAKLSAQKYISGLYEEVDSKQKAVIEHLWELEAEKVGVPKGSMAEAAWELFKAGVCNTFDMNENDFFGIPIEYGKLSKELEKYKHALNECKNELSDARASLHRYMHRAVTEWDMNTAFAKYIIKMTINDPDSLMEFDIGMKALDVLTDDKWRYEYPTPHNREMLVDAMRFYWVKCKHTRNYHAEKSHESLKDFEF